MTRLADLAGRVAAERALADAAPAEGARVAAADAIGEGARDHGAEDAGEGQCTRTHIRYVPPAQAWYVPPMSRENKCIGWGDEQRAELAAARARMPGGAGVPDVAVIRWALVEAAREAREFVRATLEPLMRAGDSGARLRSAREAAGLSTRALPAILGVSRMAVWRMERGELPITGAVAEWLAQQ